MRRSFTIYDAASGAIRRAGTNEEALVAAGPGEAILWDVKADPRREIIQDGARLAKPGPTAAELLARERARMAAYRLAFEDAMEQTPHGAGHLLEAVEALLGSLPARQQRRYANITVFERTRPEVSAFLQDSGGINLSDAEVDDLFRLAMQIEAA